MENVVTPLQALLLACVQGATEFIPVSSSGHLVILRNLCGWSDDGGLFFDTILHAGSLAAILIYFWREWMQVAQGLVRPKRVSSFYRYLPWFLVIAVIPAAIAAAGLFNFLEDETGARNMATTGLSMIATGLWFWLCDRCEARRADSGRTLENFNWRDAFWMGMAQVVALLPGASRSGWTTGAGVLRGHSRAGAVRFSFYMAAPAIVGALIIQLPALWQAGPSPVPPALMLAGFGCSFVVRLLAIRLCLWFFRAHSFRLFRYYMLTVGTALLIWEFIS